MKPDASKQHDALRNYPLRDQGTDCVRSLSPARVLARLRTATAPDAQRRLAVQSQSMSRPSTEVLRHVGRAV